MKEVNKRKSLILLTIGVLALLIVILGAAYAFFQVQTNGSESFDINATAGTTDNFTFRMEDLNIGDEAKKIVDNHNKDGENENTEIVIEANQKNFVQGGNNIGDGVKATASLIANNYNYTASYTYNLYLNINENNFVYTNEEESTPELVMVVKENGKYLDKLGGLSTTTVQVKDEEEPVTAFDITTSKNFIKIASDKAIDATEETGGKTEDVWEISIIFLNLENDQIANTDKQFDAELSIQTQKINYLNLGNKDYAFYRETSLEEKGYREQIKNVHIVDYIAEEETLNKIANWDLSSNSDGSIMGWLVQANEDEVAPYDLYIGYEGELKAKSLAYAFCNMKNLETIDGLEKIDTLNVTNMAFMFYNTKIDVLDLSTWDTTQVTNMYAMFAEMTNLTEIQGIENFKTKNVKEMGFLFNNTSVTTLDLSTWDTSQVTDMYAMFANMPNLTEIQGIENFKTENVTNMGYIFSNTALSVLNLSTWNTTQVTSMDSMFANMPNLTKIQGIENFKTENVTNMHGMFYNTKLSTLNLNKWNVSKVTDMSYMFCLSTLVTLDLREWDTSQVTNMDRMFASIPNLTEIKGIEEFKTSKVTNMSYMFYNTKLSTLNLNKWNVSKVTDMSYMFCLSTLVTLDLREWDTSQVTNMDRMFASIPNLTEIKGIEEFKTSKVTNMSYMFYDIAISTLDLTNWNISQVTNMDSMFANMPNLTEIQGIEDFKTNNVTNMHNIFNGTALSTLDLSTWDTSQVTDMQGMFYNMTNLTEIQGIEDFKTSNVTNMSYMFYNTKLSTLNLSNWDTSQVIDMKYMFSNTLNLTTLNMTNAKFTQLTSYENMFSNINPALKVTITSVIDGVNNEEWFLKNNVLTKEHLEVLQG